MKKTVFVYGLIAGIISVIALALSPLLAGEITNETLQTGMYIGYTSIFLSAILICFGMASYKKNKLGGSISFGQALGMGLLTCLIASTVYVLVWSVMYKPFFSGFGKQYAAIMMADMKKKGKSEKEIGKMKENMELYDNNALYRAAITYIEPLPVQIPMVLIAAIVLSRKKKKPATL
jgi:hypothetical protein